MRLTKDSIERAKLPEAGKSLGHGMREFKQSLSGESSRENERG